jgi:hypothetical protein
MKLSEYTDEQITTMRDERAKQLEDRYLWKHKDRLYMALANEWEKRILKHGG